MTTWTLTPSWSKPPLSMNDRMHFHAKAAQSKWIRLLAATMARKAHIPALAHVTVAMVWTVPDKRRRDAENPVATLKPYCDGLVDAGIVRDDTPDLMTKLMPRIEYVKGESGVRFEISGVDALEAQRAAANELTRDHTFCDCGQPWADRRPGVDRG